MKLHQKLLLFATAAVLGALFVIGASPSVWLWWELLGDQTQDLIAVFIAGIVVGLILSPLLRAWIKAMK